MGAVNFRYGYIRVVFFFVRYKNLKSGIYTFRHSSDKGNQHMGNFLFDGLFAFFARHL